LFIWRRSRLEQTFQAEGKVTEEFMGRVQCMGRGETSGSDEYLILAKGLVRVLEKNM